MNTKFLLILLTAGIAFSPVSHAASGLGYLKESIGLGKNLSIGLNQNSNGAWYLNSNSNSPVASAKINSDSVFVTGNSVGSTTLAVCTDSKGSNCMKILISVVAVGQVLGASTIAQHPAKSWVLQGKTVFYINASGLIPIPTWSIFLSNGGKQSLIQTIYPGDLSLPLQPLMTPNDSRVQN